MQLSFRPSLLASRLALPTAALLLGSFSLGSCADSAAGPAAPGSGGEAASKAQDPVKDPIPAPGPDANRFAPGGAIPDEQLGDYYVTMTCEVDGKDVGTMTFDLWTEAAPITTRNFLRLADEGFYEGLKFHRIMRNFMVQGGDPLGNGTGSSPHGNIQGEFSEEPERQHGYGVLSMARGGRDVNSASSQFFLCCDESENVWNLDGSYASFARLTSGVKTLETLASVPVSASRTGEPSKPNLLAKITKTTVVKGDAPTGEVVQRPEEELDLGGEPRKIRIQQILVGFKGMANEDEKSTRTEAEAKDLAAKLSTQIEGGADMSPLVREYTALPFEETDEAPGDYRVLNTGVRDRASERQQFNLMRSFRKRVEVMQKDLQQAKITRDEYQAAGMKLQAEFNAAQVMLGDALTVPRTGLDPALGGVAFGMKVGEVIVLEHDKEKGSIGYRVIKRLE